MEKPQQCTVASREDIYHLDLDLPQIGWPNINERNRKKDLAKLIANRIKNKRDLNSPIKFSSHETYCPPLIEACKSDDTLEITKELLSYNVDKDVGWFSESFGEWRPIHEAVRRSAVETVSILAAAGANLELQCKKGVRPLHQAARPIPGVRIITNWDKPDLIKLWEDKKRKILKVLLEHGANPNARDDLGRTPLFEFAVPGLSMTDDFPLVALLLEYGARTSIKDKEGKTIKSIARQKYGKQEDIYLDDLISFFKREGKPFRLLGLLSHSKKKESLFFKVLPKEIVRKTVKYIYPESNIFHG